jgi:hypothetical protein
MVESIQRSGALRTKRHFDREAFVFNVIQVGSALEFVALRCERSRSSATRAAHGVARVASRTMLTTQSNK